MDKVNAQHSPTVVTHPQGCHVQQYNRTYQSIYIIDYYRKNFLYVSDNPLFLCGHTADEVRQMGYGFYLSHVPENEVPMLTELNRSGFRAFYDEPVENRRQCMMSYDFHITNGDRLLLVNHKITPLAMTDEGRVWLALCTVSLSPHKEAGHIEFFQFFDKRSDKVDYHTGEKREYSLEAHRWREDAPLVRHREVLPPPDFREARRAEHHRSPRPCYQLRPRISRHPHDLTYFVTQMGNFSSP